MKKIIIVNNNMKVGGVQKSLYNLLWTVSDLYDITLYLFNKSGTYAEHLPPNVKIETCKSLFRYLGMSQAESRSHIHDRIIRSILAALCKLLGRPVGIRLISLSQKNLLNEYDVAISYLQNGNIHSFYGGVNEFVLQKVRAKKKIAFLHCDYAKCGANNPENNKLYYQFDKIAACSGGCRNSFLQIMPELKDKCVISRNFHRYEYIHQQAMINSKQYAKGRIHAVMVGRLAHEKAVDRGIRAVSYVNRAGIPTDLHLVGDGPMREQLMNVAKTCGMEGHVHFYGEQANPYQFMRNADLLLITSYYEAAPMIIDEAYCLGVPILSVATTSSKEMILDRGCGWVCDNSQSALNKALEEMLRDKTTLKMIRLQILSNRINNNNAMKQFISLIEN